MNNPQLLLEHYSFHRTVDEDKLVVHLLVDHANGTLTISPDVPVEDAYASQGDLGRERYQRRYSFGHFGFVKGGNTLRWANVLSLMMEANTFGTKRLLEGRAHNLVTWTTPVGNPAADNR